MSFSELISPLVGRWVLAWFFLSEAYVRASAWDANVSLLEMRHIPMAPLLLMLALMVMILGGLSLILGLQARHGAMFLFGFTIVATALMHDYWNVANPVARAADYDIFARNIAIAGGLLMVVGMGGGPFAFDNRTKKRH